MRLGPPALGGTRGSEIRGDEAVATKGDRLVHHHHQLHARTDGRGRHARLGYARDGARRRRGRGRQRDHKSIGRQSAHPGA